MQNESKLYNDNPKDFNRISHRFDEKSYLKDRKLNENISNLSKSCHEHNDINIGATPKNFNINLNPKLDKSIINSPDKENSPVKLFHKRSTVKNYGENSQEGHQKMGNDSSEIKNIKIISCKPASKGIHRSAVF